MELDLVIHNSGGVLLLFAEDVVRVPARDRLFVPLPIAEHRVIRKPLRPLPVERLHANPLVGRKLRHVAKGQE